MKIQLDIVATYDTDKTNEIHKTFDFQEWMKFIDVLGSGNYILSQLIGGGLLSDEIIESVEEYYDFIEEITDIHKIDVIELLKEEKEKEEKERLENN